MKRPSLIGFASVLAVVCALAPVSHAQGNNTPPTPFRLLRTWQNLFDTR
jgi:hypothetical protein